MNERNTMMFVGKRDQEYIISDGDYQARFIRACKIVIESARNLQSGNYSHGMGNLSYWSKYIYTILCFKSNNEELINISYDMAMLTEALYMGMYQGQDKIWKLKKVDKDCNDLMCRVTTLQ